MRQHQFVWKYQSSSKDNRAWNDVWRTLACADEFLATLLEHHSLDPRIEWIYVQMNGYVKYCSLHDELIGGMLLPMCVWNHVWEIKKKISGAIIYSHLFINFLLQKIIMSNAQVDSAIRVWFSMIHFTKRLIEQGKHRTCDGEWLGGSFGDWHDCLEETNQERCEKGWFIRLSAVPQEMYDCFGDMTFG